MGEGGERGPVAIVLNEAAQAGRSAATRRGVELAQHRLDADLHVVATRDPAELRAWLADRLAGYRKVVVAGGDGSLNAAFNVLAGRDVEIGFLPAGFGNATAHLLRLPASIEEQVRLLVDGTARPLDLVRVSGEGAEPRVTLFAGAGWDAVAAEHYARTSLGHYTGWGWAIVRSLPAAVRRFDAEVAADGQIVHAGPMEFVVAGTTPYYGRGLLVNPGAHPDRGRLRARVYRGPAPKLAVEAVRWAAHRRPVTAGMDVDSIEVRSLDGLIPVQADGDTLGWRERWRFELAPATVRLIGRW